MIINWQGIYQNAAAGGIWNALASYSETIIIASPVSTIYARAGATAISAIEGSKSIQASAGAGKVIHG